MENLFRDASVSSLVAAQEEEALLALKQAEIRSHFFDAPLEDIRRNNLEDWVLEYFFNGRDKECLQAGEVDDLAWSVDFIVRWLGLPIGEGRNPAVRCMRLSRDSLPAVHRPLWIYGLTVVVLPWLTAALLHREGFDKFRAGSLEYWHRPAKPGGAPGAPVVFCHGLGIGVLPYVQFVMELGRSGAELFLVDLPHISMKPKEEVPSSAEMVACVRDMLAAWGHAAAHFVGHSFGTFFAAWVLKRAPRLMLTVALLDPVCFLVMKADLLSNALYKDHTRLVQYMLQHVVFQELYICHTLMRNLFWWDSNVFAEELTPASLVLLSGLDDIVPAHSVRRYLDAELGRREAKEALRGATFVRQAPSETDLGSIAAGPVAGGPTGSLRLIWKESWIHMQYVQTASSRREVADAVWGLIDGHDKGVHPA